MATESDTDRFYFERAVIPEDEDPGFKYDWVQEGDDEEGGDFDEEDNEDFDNAVKLVQQASRATYDKMTNPEKPRESKLTLRPELPEDFIRNFLVSMGMTRTLDTFQEEWFELQEKGLLSDSSQNMMDDVYSLNIRLEKDLVLSREEAERFRLAACKAREKFNKLLKERDHHKLQHRRLYVENERLRKDMEQLKVHFSQYEPTITKMVSKYEIAMKEKMLAKLQLEKIQRQIDTLQNDPPLSLPVQDIHQQIQSLITRQQQLQQQQNIKTNKSNANPYNSLNLTRSPQFEMPPTSNLGKVSKSKKSNMKCGKSKGDDKNFKFNKTNFANYNVGNNTFVDSNCSNIIHNNNNNNNNSNNNNKNKIINNTTCSNDKNNKSYNSQTNGFDNSLVIHRNYYNDNKTVNYSDDDGDGGGDDDDCDDCDNINNNNNNDNHSHGSDDDEKEEEEEKNVGYSNNSNNNNNNNSRKIITNIKNYAPIMGPTQTKLFIEKNKSTNQKRDGCDDDSGGGYDDTIMWSKFPKDPGYNPLLSQITGTPPYLLRNGGFQLKNSVDLHDQAVLSIKKHPCMDIMASTSNDKTCKLWNLKTNDLQHCLQGHMDYVTDCDFNFNGTHLATVSGDKSIKIWNLSSTTGGYCLLCTITGHLKTVWSCSWHVCGTFVATCSMDRTARIWDLNCYRSKHILRGHTDSVNSVEFLHYSNILLTSSTDKNICLWDARMNVCGGVYKGHKHAVNTAKFNLRGNAIISCDSGGNLMIWDVRTKSCLTELKCDPQSVNMAAFDSTGTLAVLACNDNCVKIVELSSHKVRPMRGHTDSVQCIYYDFNGEYVLSGSNDCTIKLWS